MPVILPPEAPNGVWSAGVGPFNQVSTPFTNPSISGLTYIGSVSQEWIADLPVFETPFAADPKEYVYKLLYKVKADAFQRMALYQAGPYGGIHVGESNFRTSAGGILSFFREFARKPDSRNEYESYVYSYQYPVGSGGFADVPTTVVSRVQYDYFETDQPDTIWLPRAPRLVNIDSVNYELGNYLDLDPGDQFLAEDAVMRPWKGRIYERQMRFVEWRDFTTE